jgi:hypothetical protein
MLIGAIILIAKDYPEHFSADIWTKETWPMAIFWLIAMAMAVLSL